MKNGIDFICWLRGFFDCMSLINGNDFIISMSEFEKIKEKLEEAYCNAIEDGKI